MGGKYLVDQYGDPITSTNPLPVNGTMQLTGSNTEYQAVDSTAVNVSDIACAIANITLGWGTGHFEASFDGGTTYSVLAVKNIKTGTSFHRIDLRGTYFLDLRGATHLKYSADYTIANSGGNSASVTFYPTYAEPSYELEPRSVKRYAPSPLIGSMVQPTSNRIITDVDLANAVLYATAGPNISKSADYNATWTNVISSGHPWGAASLNDGTVKKLKNGKLLVVVVDVSGLTKVYLSDTNEANFAEVYSFTKEGIMHVGFGVSVYGDIILIAPYKSQPRLAADPLHIHLSKDGGSTFATIHTAPATDSWHYHDAVYDPYQQRIWFCAGDNFGLSEVQYSDNFGATWETLWTLGQSPTQFTTIHPMPDCVIFGTDQAGFQGAYRYYRQPNDKGSIAKHIYEPAYSRRAPGGSGDATYRGKQYWESGNAVYWASVTPTCIIATKDGETFYQVWGSPLATTAVNRIFGVDKNNKLIACGNSSGAGGLLVVDAPTWTEI